MDENEVKCASKLYDEVFSGITNEEIKACVDIKKILPKKIRKTVRESMLNKNPVDQLHEMGPFFLENDEKKLKKSSKQKEGILKKITDRNKMLEKHSEVMDDGLVNEIQQFIKYLRSMMEIFKLSQRRLMKALQYWVARSEANEKYKLKGMELVQRTFIRFVQDELSVARTLECYHLFSAWLSEAVEVWDKNNYSEFLKFIGFDYMRIREPKKFPQQLTVEVHAMFKRNRYPPLHERRELMDRYGISPDALGRRFRYLREIPNIRKVEAKKQAQGMQELIHEKTMRKEYQRTGKQIHWKKKKPPDEELIIPVKPIEKLVTVDPVKKHFVNEETLFMVPLVRKLSDIDIIKVQECLKNHEKYYCGPWTFLWDNKQVKRENFIPITFRRYKNVLTKVESPKFEWNDSKIDKKKIKRKKSVKKERKIKQIKQEIIKYEDNEGSMEFTDVNSCDEKSTVNQNEPTKNQPNQPLVIKLPMFKTKKKERHKEKTEETICDKSFDDFEYSMTSESELNKTEIKIELKKRDLEHSIEDLFQFNPLPNTSSNFLQHDTRSRSDNSNSSETDTTDDSDLSDKEISIVSLHSSEDVPDISQLFASSNTFKYR